jgi:hypothetical protein
MANPNGHPDGEWIVYNCVANDFNRFQVDWTKVDVFVSDVNWNDSGNTGKQWTSLGPPGTESGIQFGVNNGPLNWLTSTDPHSPDHFSYDHAFLAVCVTGDSYQQDNTGGYRIHVRRHHP